MSALMVCRRIAGKTWGRSPCILYWIYTMIVKSIITLGQWRGSQQDETGYSKRSSTADILMHSMIPWPTVTMADTEPHSTLPHDRGSRKLLLRNTSELFWVYGKSGGRNYMALCLRIKLMVYTLNGPKSIRAGVAELRHVPGASSGISSWETPEAFPTPFKSKSTKYRGRWEEIKLNRTSWSYWAAATKALR